MEGLGVQRFRGLGFRDQDFQFVGVTFITGGGSNLVKASKPGATSQMLTSGMWSGAINLPPPQLRAIPR